MRVVVTGGTGFIGSALCRGLVAGGDVPVVLTRNAADARRRLGEAVEAAAWQPGQSGSWEQALDGADAIVNLAGESIAARRWSERQKEAIRGSRIRATRALVEALGR